MQKHKYRLFLYFCFAGFCAAILPATAGTVNSIPYFCGFEENELSGEYTVDTPLINGLGGWYASSEEVVVTDQKKMAGSHSAMIPLDTTLTNLFEVNPGYTNVWVQMDIRPDLYEVEGHPAVDPDTTALFYINSNGYFVVHNGEYNPADPDAGWTEVEAGKIDETSQDWIRLNMIVDYDAKRWTLYANGVFVTNEIGFVDETIESFCGFALYNGGGTTYVDNVFVEHRADHNPKFTLSFDQQPVNTTAGETIPAVRVEALDVNENRMLVFTNDINIEIGNNAGGGVLSGTTNRTAVEGLATFDDLSIDKSGTGYTLSAIDEHEGASGGAVESDAFNITPGDATHLTITQEPSETAANDVAFAQQPRIQLRDAYTNAVPADNVPVTAEIVDNAGGALIGAVTVNTDANGLAIFSNLGIKGTAGEYTLKFTSGVLDETPSSRTITLSYGAATHLTITQEPSETAANDVAFAQQPRIQLRDSGTNAVPADNVPVTAEIVENAGGALIGAVTANTDANGLAIFLNLGIKGTAGEYTLKFTSGILDETPSSRTITLSHGEATHLVFDEQPSNTIAGGHINPAVVIHVMDSATNRVPTYNDDITVRILNNAGGGTLSGETNVSADSGIATFDDLSIDKTGEGYTLGVRDSAEALPEIESDPFDITHAAANHVVLTGPEHVVAGHVSGLFTLKVYDPYTNETPVTADTTFALTSDSTGITNFYSDALGETNINSELVITNEGVNAAFYYWDAAPGTQRVVTATWTEGGVDLNFASHEIGVQGLLVGVNEVFIHYNEEPALDKGTDFGNVPIASAATNVFGVTNMFGVAITNITWTTNGPHAEKFEVLDMPTNMAPDGLSSNMTVKFDPSGEAGVFTGKVVIVTEYDDNTVTNYLNLKGTGTEGMIDLSVARLDFEAIYRGADPEDQQFEISNSGAGPFTFTLSTNRNWLSVSPVTETLEAGETNIINARVKVAGLNAGTNISEITITAPTAENSPQTVDVFFAVSRADQEIENFLPADGSAFLTMDTAGLSAKADSNIDGLSVSFAVVPGDPGVITGGTNLAFTGEGRVRVVASQHGNTNWNAAVNITNTFVVSKADQTIENFLPADGSVFKTTETAGLSASASSGLEVVFAVSAGPGVITGGTNLAFTGAGSVSVTASQAGDENWNPAPDVTRTYHVKRSMVKDDFTGDGRSVLWFYHQESATWFLLTPEGLMDPIQFGSPGAVPAEYDYEGDGKCNIAVYEAGAWQILLEDGATRMEYWGWPGAEAVPGDYSGDGTGDLAVYDPEGGLWFIASLAGEIIAWGEQFGGPGMIPVPGDYSGNGVTDMAVYDRFTGSWYIRTLAGEWLAWDFNFGWSETTPLTLDFDGDGRSDLAVYHRAEGMWYILTWRNEFYMIQFGWHEAEPLTGDFDGDGLDDIAVLHRDRNDAVWHLLRSAEGYGMVSVRGLRPADD